MHVDLAKVVAGIIAAASLGWGTYVSSSVIDAKERLARIETKIDALMEQAKNGK
jgi:hypothetical protein